jgi:CRISPR-associated protein Cmr5
MAQRNSQKMAQKAYDRMAARNPEKEYASFARRFPSLIHTCGLAQAVAFAQVQRREQHQLNYLEDLCAVLGAAGYTALINPAALDGHLRACQLSEYIRLSRTALLAAGWLKRYTEALTES